MIDMDTTPSHPELRPDAERFEGKKDVDRVACKFLRGQCEWACGAVSSEATRHTTHTPA